jgi:hypothetical protein
MTFHGRVIDHLGIQMYQSPVAAIAELVANAWDADAESVSIRLPADLGPGAEITIKDSGHGMTFEECQEKYLNVGWGRRGDDPNETSSGKGRPILGRKGIGKFAGFGIAEVIRIDTVSEQTGERTIFEMKIKELRGEKYISGEGGNIPAECFGPDDALKGEHGTTISLKSLKMARRPSPGPFARSMARRFLLHQRQDDFTIAVNGEALPEGFNLAGVQFEFPRDYLPAEKPSGLRIDDHGWGIETVGGQEIRWRFLFQWDTIDEEELRGIAVFAKGKLAQSPFLFNLTGGLGGQHGVEYLYGQVDADYLDSLADDVISTERQRIDWIHESTQPLLLWGQDRVKVLLRIWRDRRGAERLHQLETKVARFSPRLDKLQPHEAETVKRALARLGQIPTLSQDQFADLGDAVLTAWEQGRLRQLIATVAEVESLSEEDVLGILFEADVLTGLNIAEAVTTKILTVGGLKLRIQKRELELAVRDYIAKNPWLISPRWETFRIERTVHLLLEDCAQTAGMTGSDWAGRIDLALASGQELLVIEFMRPGIKVDWDHMDRFERYVRILMANINANTGGRFRNVTGYLVADSLESDPAMASRIAALANQHMFAMDWPTLFSNALAGWQEFLEALSSRAPKDARLSALLGN